MNISDHEDLRDLLGVYALNAVDQEERACVEAHLDGCDECAQEVREHTEVAGLLIEADTSAPTVLWDRIRDDALTPYSTIHATDSDVRQLESAPSIERAARWRMIATVAAVAALTVLVGVQTIRLDAASTRLEGADAQIAAFERAIAEGDYQALVGLAAAAPGARTVDLAGDAGAASAVILPDGSGYVEVTKLDPIDELHTYQLWAIIDGEVISAGILGGHSDVAPFQVDLELLEGLVVTEELAGGVAVSDQPAVSAWLAET
jgi:hypothetical protein